MLNLHLRTEQAQTFLCFASELRRLGSGEFVFVTSVELEPATCLEGAQGVCLGPWLTDPSPFAALPTAARQGILQGKLQAGSPGTRKAFSGGYALGMIRK